MEINSRSNRFLILCSNFQLDREVEILKNLRHPNIVSIIDTLDENDYFFLVLELAEGRLLLKYISIYLFCLRPLFLSFDTGGELFDRIDQVGHFEERDAREVFMQILNAIEYLHSQNIVHRDLKVFFFFFFFFFLSFCS